MSLDNIDRRILDLVQVRFPLADRPFSVVAQQARTTEADVIGRLARLKQSGVVREISAVFDSAHLGYRSTLVAMAVEPERLEEVAAIVSAHSGVSHNYERAHAYNLWFTLTVPGDRSLEDEIGRMAGQGNVRDFLILPALRRFKIRVDFDLGTRGPDEQDRQGELSDGNANEDPSETPEGAGDEHLRAAVLDAVEISAVRALQRDLPLVQRPFQRLAAEVGMGEGELLATARRFVETGMIRRYGAVLRHRQAGFAANAMVGWVIAPERIEQAGHRAAAERAISHCYERPAYPPRWPFNLITMVHGRSEADIGQVVERLRADLRPADCAVLFSGREFKKQRVRYFEE